MVCPLYDSTVIGFKAPTHDSNCLRGVFSCTEQTLRLIQKATILATSTNTLRISCQPNIWSAIYVGTPFGVTFRETTQRARSLSVITEESVVESESDELPATSPESLESAICLEKAYAGDRGVFFVPPSSRFFVIKSFSLEDVEASFKNGIWTSTALGNKRLNKAYLLDENASVFLFFSVNASMKFCGVARMEDKVDFSSRSEVWSEHSRWNGVFPVSWLVVKDVSNKRFKHLRVPLNENKPVTNSRDTQELPFEVGLSMLNIFTE